MTWIKLEDKAPRHPKVSGLSDKAFRVWITSLCYASEFLTDGILPPAYLLTVKQGVQDELLKAGLWDRDGDLMRIHDYLGHQTSREKIESKRRYARDQKQKVSGNFPEGFQKPTAPEYREQNTEADTETKQRGMRAPVQGRGAFPPGSLHRDHLHHALCGPEMRICLKTWEFNVLAKAYNEPDNPHGTRALIAQFIEVLEKGVTPNDSIGPFSWVEKEFHTYLKSVGRVPPKITPKVEPFSVAKALEREAARKAGAQ